jgi:hypothetical protein
MIGSRGASVSDEDESKAHSHSRRVDGGRALRLVVFGALPDSESVVRDIPMTVPDL